MKYKMCTLGSINQTVSWVRKVTLRQSPSKEHKEAWRAFERDRMKLANLVAAVFIIVWIF